MKIPFWFFAGILIAAPTSGVLAQTSDYLIVTWRAENLYPADFQGRAWATPGSPIKASVEAVIGGKLTSLASSEITWLLDETLLEKGIGSKTIRFTARSSASNNHFLRVQAKVNGKSLEESVRIPVKRAELVMEVPVLNKTIPAASEIKISAVPYFFNAESLENIVFNWIINNARQKQTGNGNLTLKVGQPQTESQQKMVLTANAQNLSNPLEIAQDRKSFSISQ